MQLNVQKLHTICTFKCIILKYIVFVISNAKMYFFFTEEKYIFLN